jgi:gliding motility-associated-like protein
MFIKKLSLLVLLISILFCNVALGATFIVTSNIDTGPGTLREALINAAANGTATQDIIRFQLPGTLVSDRTIRLKSELPAVTSNVIIDGTSQPGIAFGVSDARVIIEPETTPAYFNGLFINGDPNSGGAVAKNIEIYGLYIRNFARITSFANPDFNQGSGIYIRGDASNIIIGVPGKGNVICGNLNAIANYSSYYNVTGLADAIIQSNIIGLLDDGYTAASNFNGLNLYISKTVTIGGANVNMGNIISANAVNIGINSTSSFTVVPSTINIQNNKIGTDYTGKKDFKNIPLFQQNAFMKAFGISISTTNTTANIISNIISGQRYAGIAIDQATFNITGNKIGTDITGTADLGNGEGIRVGESSSGTIGGPATTDKNYIGYNQYGIEALNSKHTLITQNSIFCNKDYGISVISNYYTVPYVQVLNFGSTAVSGVATPNAAIELFFSDDCGTICQGKTYITTVQSDASGKWAYSGSITKAVIATATDANKNTSPFSSLVIRDDDIVVKDYTCNPGSITIKQDRSGLLFHWDKKEQNGSLTSIKDGQNVSGLLPGTYQLTVQYPGGCQKVTQLFEIKDLRIKIQNVIVPVPECRQKQFLFDVNFTGGAGNITFVWKDKNGNIVSNTRAPYLPEGSYTVTIYDEAGCSATSSLTPPIKAKPGPDYDLSTMIVNPARCGIADGSIKNITTKVGIGTLTYKWLDAAGKTVGTSKDLVGVKGGTYTLVLMDQSECSPYATSPIYISETNSVIIYDGFITPAKCGENNGSITGVGYQNANQLQWYDPQGNPIPTNPANLDIFNLADGTYRLNALNTITQCSNDKYFTVGRLTPEVFTIKNLINIPTTCGLNNGSLHIDFEGTIKPSSYQWVDAAGTTVSYGTDVPSASPGSYTLHVTDKNGCASVLGTWEIQATPLLQFSINNAPVTKTDECDQLLGTIKGIDVTGGVLPYKFTWADASGNTVGSDKDLINVGKGTYSLTVTDNTSCAIPLTYNGSIGNQEFVPDAPVLNDQRICVPGKVGLSVVNKTIGNYNLYADATSTVAMQTSNTGNFEVQITETSDYYISYSIGSCESPRTKTHIEVVLIDVKFPNTITPNSDGVNDYWKIEGLEKFPGTVVQIFNRYGKKVFESKEYATPFTGQFNGWLLPSGVYYYIINLNTPCKLLSGNLTLIR